MKKTMNPDRLQCMPLFSDHGHAVHTSMGTIGGTLSSLFVSLQVASLTETIVLSALGAVVSFVVSALLQWTVNKIRNVKR
jgi:hypothetical protein